MELPVITTFFRAAESVTDKKPDAKEDDGLCTRILNIVKEAIAFFVNAITCGQVKVFEVTDESSGSEAAKKKKKSLPLQKDLESAVKVADISQEAYEVQLHALVIFCEIIGNVCDKGEKIKFRGDKKGARIHIELPKSLAPNKTFILAILQRLLQIFVEDARTTAKDEPYPNKVYVTSEDGEDSLFVSFAKPNPEEKAVKIRSFEDSSDTTALVRALQKMGIVRVKDRKNATPRELLPKGSPQAYALSVILRVFSNHEVNLKASFERSDPDKRTPPKITFVELWDHIDQESYEFCRKLVGPTWNLVCEYIGGLDSKTPLAFVFDEKECALVPDMARLKKHGLVLGLPSKAGGPLSGTADEK